ncbi:hypothetical protein GCM10011367_27440 [Marinicauda pacifica]|uniref:PepSY domain-containing protein n=1 Tax=Marinicauda pacifica TaxID=1133559 RepID=A0A4S2H7E0_9PROT|nr:MULTISPECIES: PepSY domain-containing protein [Marinicauda]TGY91735.1 hypothetical protein E5162_14070 [Marinicauda pacifica]GGE51026.1 hypothetical protein GCM10011367_27440 [Marinicauda pacifica]
MIRSLVISILLLASGGVCAPALAQQSSFSADQARDARQAGEIMSGTEIYRLMQRRYPSAYSIEIADLIGGQRPVYVVRVFPTPDRREDVYVDARTGAPVPQSQVHGSPNRY